MALPLLLTLPKTARIAFPIIQAGTRRGLSSRAIESIVRQAGLSISRGRSILPIMREVQAIEAAGANIRFIPKHLTINTARLPLALTDIRRDFSFSVRVRGRDAFGNLIDRHVTVSTDRTLITPGEIEEAADFLVSAEGQSETLAEVTSTLQTGVQRVPRSL